MSALCHRVALPIALLLAAGSAPAQSPPPIDPALRARFGFLGPDVVKVGDGINLLRVADLDGDGAAEIVVYYGQRGRLEVISRGANGPEIEHVDAGGVVRGLAIADVDASGSPEFLVLTDRGRLVVRRCKDGRSIAEVEVGPPGSGDALRAGDLDGDGRADAVAWTRDGIVTVLDPAGTPRVLPAIAVGEERWYSFQLFDADGDQRLDLVLATAADSFGLRLMRGEGAGFGPWLLFDVPTLIAAFRGTSTGGAPTLALLQDARRRVVEYRIERQTEVATRSSAAVQWTSLPLRKRGAFPFAHGDVDGDGHPDLILAHPERAELVYLLERDGGFERRTAPTLAGVNSLALGDVDGDGHTDLVLTSGEERAVAWRSGTDPLDRFPARLPTQDEPLAAVVAPEGGVLFVAKDKRREGSLYRVARSGDEFEPAAAVAKLGRLGGDPQRLLLAELDATRGPELALVVPGDGLVVLRSTEPGGYRDVDAKSAAGFTRKIDDGALAVVRDPDAGDSLVVVLDGFARRFRLDADGQPVILSQVNAPSGSEQLSLGVVQPDGAALFLDTKAGKLYQVPKSGAARSVDVPPIGASHLLRHGEDALVIGRSGRLRIRFGPAWELAEVRSLEPPTKDTNWYAGVAADLDADGAAELALVDEDVHGVHVLVAAADRLRRALSFPCFELNEAANVFEPRAVTAGDVDGDGRQDLVLIAFDRVLVYRQEE